jgi:hypothetical protein
MGDREGCVPRGQRAAPFALKATASRLGNQHPAAEVAGALGQLFDNGGGEDLAAARLIGDACGQDDAQLYERPPSAGSHGHTTPRRDGVDC